jgi:hypothetical protein
MYPGRRALRTPSILLVYTVGGDTVRARALYSVRCPAVGQGAAGQRGRRLQAHVAPGSLWMRCATPASLDGVGSDGWAFEGERLRGGLAPVGQASPQWTVLGAEGRA